MGGLVNGQPVSAHDLLPNVLGDIKKSTFANLAGAQDIFDTLENHYFDRDFIGGELSDVTFVETVDATDPRSGRIGTKVVPVHGNDTAPGDAAYTVNYLGGEEIFVGVDMSLKGIREARKNPTAY